MWSRYDQATLTQKSFRAIDVTLSRAEMQMAILSAFWGLLGRRPEGGLPTGLQGFRGFRKGFRELPTGLLGLPGGLRTGLPGRLLSEDKPVRIRTTEPLFPCYGIDLTHCSDWTHAYTVTSLVDILNPSNCIRTTPWWISLSLQYYIKSISQLATVH